jgi:hypothetical protein
MKRIFFGAMIISIFSMLFLARISGAKEITGNRLSFRTMDNSAHIAILRRIANEKLEVDQDAPMKLAVDAFMRNNRSVAEATISSEQGPQEIPEDNDNRDRSNTNKNSEVGAVSGGVHPESEGTQAEQILHALIAENPLLEGATVQIRECPHNWQGCVYYKSAEIWIDPDHKASLQKILAHECDHIIDWRTDGDIDNNDYHE